MEIKNTLEEIGLTSREIAIYLSLLSLGRTTTGPLAKKSGVPLSKIYQTLDRLIEKGLVSHVLISKTKHFNALSPKNLLKVLEEKRKNVQEILPRLLELEVSSQEKQEAEIYEGLSGIKAAINNILEVVKEEGEYRVFTLGRELESEEMERFFNQYHIKRSNKKIRVKLLANKEIKSIIKRQEYSKSKGLSLRFTDYKVPTGTFIYENKVITVVWEEKPTAFVITSKKNAESYKQLFEEFWKKAKE